jgi:hypothetical protein
MFDKPPRYRSYLLTLWEERGRDPSVGGVWRYRLEDPHTGKQRGFASLEALVAALEGEMGAAGRGGGTRRAGTEGDISDQASERGGER